MQSYEIFSIVSLDGGSVESGEVWSGEKWCESELAQPMREARLCAWGGEMNGAIAGST
jgi:hypothetical protein